MMPGADAGGPAHGPGAAGIPATHHPVDEALAEAKRRLRAQLRENPPGAGALRAAGAEVCAHLARAPILHGARAVLLYAALPDEIDLGPVAETLRAQGVATAYPRADWSSGTMVPVVIRAPDVELAPGRFGVREPAPGLPAWALSDLDVVLVPGLAFDRAGNRLGRGAGFYDRFLAHPGLCARTCGVAPEARIFDSVPHGTTDIPVQFVASELGVRPAGS